MMKKKILKTLAVACCAIILVVGSVAGTMAYLTAQTQSITNTFTAGNVAITMVETKVDEYGVALTGDKAGTTSTGNTYKLIPGHTYTKNPTITVDANSENCWLFVEIENGLGTSAMIAMEQNWTNIVGTDIWYYNTMAEANKSYTPFTSFQVSATANVAALKNGTIVVTAYAVQADGFANATAAWNETFGASN